MFQHERGFLLYGFFNIFFAKLSCCIAHRKTLSILFCKSCAGEFSGRATLIDNLFDIIKRYSEKLFAQVDFINSIIIKNGM